MATRRTRKTHSKSLALRDSGGLRFVLPVRVQPPPAEWHAEQLTRRCRAGYLVRSREEEALANLLSDLGFTAETAKYEERLAGWPCAALPDQFQVLPDWTFRGVRGAASKTWATMGARHRALLHAFSPKGYFAFLQDRMNWIDYRPEIQLRFAR